MHARLLFMLIIVSCRITTQSIIDIGVEFAVLENACLSHLDGSVLVWGGANPGSIVDIGVLYHPIRDGVPGHR